MSILEFSYTPRRICMLGLGLWIVFPVGLELDEIKIPGHPSKVEVGKKSLVSRNSQGYDKHPIVP